MPEHGIVFISGMLLFWYRYIKPPNTGLSIMNYTYIQGKDQLEVAT